MPTDDDLLQDSGPKPVLPLLWALLLLFLAILEAVAAALFAKPDAGANIGLGIAVFAVLLAATAVVLAARVRRLPAALQAGAPLQLAATAAMVLAAMLVLLVAVGLLEELG